MKLRLDDDKMSDGFFEDTRILGIACTLKNYQFCWHIDQLLQIGFQTSADLQIPMEKNIKFNKKIHVNQFTFRDAKNRNLITNGTNIILNRKLLIIKK